MQDVGGQPIEAQVQTLGGVGGGRRGGGGEGRGGRGKWRGGEEEEEGEEEFIILYCRSRRRARGRRADWITGSNPGEEEEEEEEKEEETNLKENEFEVFAFASYYVFKNSKIHS